MNFALMFHLCFISSLFSAKGAAKPAAQATPAAPKAVYVLGDSISEGYGVGEKEAYPALLETRMQEKFPNTFKVHNRSISGSTSASAPARFDEILKKDQAPYMLILALGANDGLRGLDLNKSQANLEKVILKAKEHGTQVVLAGMQLPPNYGKVYTEKFKSMFTGLAEKHGVLLIPFLLEGVGGVRAMNQSDGIHPNQLGQAEIAKTVFSFLSPHLSQFKP